MKPLLSAASANFLLHASLLYKETCPELSRFYLQGSVSANVMASEKKKSTCPLQGTAVCPHCCQWLQPNNHRIRLQPKQRPSARVRRVLRRHAKGTHLSLAQRHLLCRFQRASSVLMATCHTCNKTSRHKGMNRDFIVSHSTPGSVSKHRTPQSTSRSATSTHKPPSKDKTPAHTPRSSSSSNTSGSGSSSSKTPSKSKNWVCQRLSKILLREDSKSSKKGGLKDFLSSL